MSAMLPMFTMKGTHVDDVDDHGVDGHNVDDRC